LIQQDSEKPVVLLDVVRLASTCANFLNSIIQAVRDLRNHLKSPVVT